jgi:hypothetical protein
MKRKVKKFAEGGTNVRTRTDEEFAEDSKFGGYGRYMPKTKSYSIDDVKSGIGNLIGRKSTVSEDRPIAKSSFGYEDMKGDMPAKSTFDGSTEIKPDTYKEPVTGPASGFDADKYLESISPKSAAKKTRKNAIVSKKQLEESGFTNLHDYLNDKQGKTRRMASGGKTSSASSRGDGIAQRGKTKGRMC